MVLSSKTIEPNSSVTLVMFFLLKNKNRAAGRPGSAAALPGDLLVARIYLENEKAADEKTSSAAPLSLYGCDYSTARNACQAFFGNFFISVETAREKRFQRRRFLSSCRLRRRTARGVQAHPVRI